MTGNGRAQLRWDHTHHGVPGPFVPKPFVNLPDDVSDRALGQSGFAVMQSTLVYVAAPPDRRFEAMGLLTMCIGISPLGFLAVGWLADWLGAPAAAMTCALCGLASLVLTWPVWRACLRDAPVTSAP